MVATESDELPQATWSGSFQILGVDVKCHTLSDGQRIIEENSFHALLEALASNPVSNVDPAAMQAFARWRAAIDD